ncbi:hypothetical protein WJX82_009232 [Trebouxia sp. C0006]
MSSRQGLLGQIDAIGAEAFHILLVEDDELTLKVTEGLLRHCDYQVTLARNGRQALEALQSPEGEHINLILTDVLMPEIDGIELMTELLQNEGWSHIPIIVMSSQSSQESVLKAFEAGAKDYLIKPMSLTHEPAREGNMSARLSGHVAGVTVGQQQQFFQAFQAAVEQHQLAVEACALNRRAAIAKFREKRKARNFNKKVRYESRRRLAETRPRVRGQFVKAGTAAAQSIAAQEPAAAQVASHGNGIAAME